MITRRVITCHVITGMLLTFVSSLQAGQQQANSVTSSRVRQAASDQGSATKARPTVLRMEVKQLREEVRHLRRDVQRLVQLLEAQLPESSENSNAREGRRTAAQNGPSAAELTKDAVNQRIPPSDGDGDVPLAKWNLTLKDAILIGLENSPVLKVTTRQGAKGAIIVGSEDNDAASTEAQVIGLIGEIEDAYGDLWTAHGEFQAMRQARESSLELWRQIVRNANSSPSLLEEEATGRNQYFHFRTQVNQSLQSRQAKERRLRAVLGLAADDGQTIIPAGLPDRSTSSVNWEENRNEAFANSRAIQEQRAVVRQCELQLLTRESNEAASPENGADEPETQLRNDQLRVARERARLEDLQREAMQGVMLAVRQCYTARSDLQTYRNRRSAADRELRALSELVHHGQLSTVNELLNAQQRCVASHENYFSAYARLLKTTRDLHLHKGTLLQHYDITLD